MRARTRQPPRYAEGTTVPIRRTRDEIEDLVTRHGAVNFASGWMDGNKRHAVSFVLQGRLVRFVIGLPTGTDAKAEAEARRLWRCLLLAIKAKLEVVRSGIHTFEQEFLANIVTTENVTVYEAIKLAGSNVRLLSAMESDGGDR